MNHITWRIISEFSHSSTIDSENCVIYKEVEKPLTGYPATLASVQGLPLVLETTCKFIFILYCLQSFIIVISISRINKLLYLLLTLLSIEIVIKGTSTKIKQLYFI